MPCLLFEKPTNHEQRSRPDFRRSQVSQASCATQEPQGCRGSARPRTVLLHRVCEVLRERECDSDPPERQHAQETVGSPRVNEQRELTAEQTQGIEGWTIHSEGSRSCNWIEDRQWTEDGCQGQYGGGRDGEFGVGGELNDMKGVCVSRSLTISGVAAMRHVS